VPTFARLPLTLPVALLFLVVLSVPAAAQTAGVEWTNLVNASANGSTIEKTSGCNGCPDAGATSLQVLSGPDGYLEFRPAFGGRLLMGLGRAQSPSTDPAEIDYAFNLWPDGGWDIRERGVYRGEGRFSEGDVFRVALENGVIRYYRNGAAVYASAASPTDPLIADVTLYSAGATVTSAEITVDAQTPTPVPPPTQQAAPATYDAISDREPRAKPALPDLGSAGFTFHDPVFGTRMVRVTDGATRPGMPDRSYRTPSATHSNAWSADGQYFYTVSTDGTVIPYAFDAIAVRASRLEPTGTGEGGRTLRFFAEPTFSYLRPGILYGTYNGSGSNLRSVDQYDLATQQYTTLLNLDTLVADLGGTYIGGLLNSSGASERLVAFFGGTGQDRHMYLVVFDRDDPSKRRLVDTLASTVDGVPANITLNFRIHAAAIDRSGRFVTIYPTGQDLQAPRSAAPAYVWDLTRDTFTALPLVQARSGGHDAYGYGVRVNQDCCTASTWDAAQWQFRWLADPLVTADLVNPVLTPKSVYMADHPSWHNAAADRLLPFLDATYRYGNNTAAWRAWDDEIIGVQTDAPGTGATVWRFGHHRSNVANDLDPSRISFWYTPRVNVSPDGRWALFTSNWEKSLGTDPRADTGGAARQDLFLVELRQYAGTSPDPDPDPTPDPDPAPEPDPTPDPEPAPGPDPTPDPDPPPAPLVVETGSLPDAVRDVSYEMRLAASGGASPISWGLASGALPKGLALDPTGIIRGTPQAQGMFKFVVEATDATGQSAQRALSLKVNRK
jgi:hypothetical protein